MTIFDTFCGTMCVILAIIIETTRDRDDVTNGNIFRVTGHLCWEFTGDRWIPHTKASDAELWCFLWAAREVSRLSKQSWDWWFETLSRPSWRHCNVFDGIYFVTTDAFLTGWHQGLYSLSGKMSYRQISWSLETTRLYVIMVVPLWNLTGISAAALPRCLSNF